MSASWYRPGDYSSPHSDVGHGRRIAFIWHLTESWDERDGGDLVWCSPYARFAPTPNTLYLFEVSDDSMHFVQPVYRRLEMSSPHDASSDQNAGAWLEEHEGRRQKNALELDGRKRLAINGWFVAKSG